jgi:hypothetical protein
MSDIDVGTVDQLGVAASGDKLLALDMSASPGDRVRQVNLSGSAGDYLNGQGQCVELPVSPITAVYAGTGLTGGGTEGNLVVGMSTATVDAIAANTAKVSFDASTVLTKTNTTSFTPTANFHPATKKYVDDTAAASVSGVSSIAAGTGITVSAATGAVTVSASLALRTEVGDNTAKLATIAEGAEVNVNADWNSSSGDSEILNKPTAMPNFVATYRHTTTADYVVGTEDPREAYGGVIYVTEAAKVIAPTKVDGMNFTVVTVGNVAVAVDVVDDAKIYLDGTLLAANKGAVNTSTNGDIANFTSYPGTGDDAWYVLTGTQSGDVWTEEA